MRAQRKIFRIEETMRAASDPQDALAPDAQAIPSEVIEQLNALRALMERRSPDQATATTVAAPVQEARKLKIELDVISDAIKQTRSEIISLQDQGFDSTRVSRVGKELDAVFEHTTRATDQILDSAEDIEQLVAALAPRLTDAHEQGIAQTIQERVTTIFEACNFHDLTGQRIAKVASMLTMVEEHLARMMEIWTVIDRFDADAARPAEAGPDGHLHGPMLDGDNGHSTQDEIDKLFH
jgi:chemotaxis protein CheZ